MHHRSRGSACCACSGWQRNPCGIAGWQPCCETVGAPACAQDATKVGFNIGECTNLELRGPATAYTALYALPWVQGTITSISWNGSDTVGPYRWDVQAGGPVSLLSPYSHLHLQIRGHAPLADSTDAFTGLSSV